LKIITWTKRLLLTLTFLALIATNILSLTSTAFNAALSGLMGTALGIRTVSSMMQTKLAGQDKAIKKHKATATRRKAATRKFGTRLARRTKRVAAKSIAAIPAESIPLIGVAVLIADTGYELYAACESIRDLDVLYAELGMANEAPDDVMHSVCDPTLPDAGEVWDGVLEKSGEWWDVWPLRRYRQGNSLHRRPGYYRPHPGSPAQEGTRHPYSATTDTTDQGSTRHIASFRRAGRAVAGIRIFRVLPARRPARGNS
jgi:hypothetical protein